MFMELNLQNIVYSNSEYFDVLDIFFDEQKKFGIDKNNYILFSDCESNGIKTILYNNNKPYAERLLKCLEKIEEEIILYQHEDMFLYDNPDFSKINEYIKFLKSSPYSFIRLSRTGNCNLKKIKEINSLYEISSDSIDFFAVQPSIWKTKDLIKFLSFGLSMSIWDLEINSSFLCSKNNISGLLHFNNEKKRGGHYDSSVWPYIATAIIKGKWNQIEYAEEMNKIHKIKNSKRATII